MRRRRRAVRDAREECAARVILARGEHDPMVTLAELRAHAATPSNSPAADTTRTWKIRTRSSLCCRA